MVEDRQQSGPCVLPRHVAQWMRDDIEKWRGNYRLIAFMVLAGCIGIVAQIVLVVVEVMR